MTPSEKLVADLCERAFLALWTHPMPRGKKRKELCDCLVVCGPHIVVISVKEVDYRDTGDMTGWERWQREAIDGSVRQVYGAERWLRDQDTVERLDGRIVHLPPKADRVFHRIIVALGGRGEVPTKFGDFEKGFVHLLDEDSLSVVLSELDTISDLIGYLTEVERLVRNGTDLMFMGGGAEDLVALYTQHGTLDPSVWANGASPTLVMLDHNLWTGFRGSRAYRTMKAVEEASYYWDRLIGFFIGDLLTDGFFDFFSKQPTQNDLGLSTMALEPRRTRRVLGEAFMDSSRRPAREGARRGSWRAAQATPTSSSTAPVRTASFA